MWLLPTILQYQLEEKCKLLPLSNRFAHDEWKKKEFNEKQLSNKYIFKEKSIKNKTPKNKELHQN